MSRNMVCNREHPGHVKRWAAWPMRLFSRRFLTRDGGLLLILSYLGCSPMDVTVTAVEGGSSSIIFALLGAVIAFILLSSTERTEPDVSNNAQSYSSEQVCFTS
jgi:hypothetical protein